MADTLEQDTHARAKFREMKQGTAEDWSIIGTHFREFAPHVADRVLDHLRLPPSIIDRNRFSGCQSIEKLVGTVNLH